MMFQCQLDQPINEFWVRQAAGRPQAWVHADVGETGDGVDFICIGGSYAFSAR